MTLPGPSVPGPTDRGPIYDPPTLTLPGPSVPGPSVPGPTVPGPSVPGHQFLDPYISVYAVSSTVITLTVNPVLTLMIRIETVPKTLMIGSIGNR